MKILIAILACTLTMNASRADGFDPEMGRTPDYIGCLKEHRKILQTYDAQLESEVLRIMNGLAFEKNKKTNAYGIQSYEKIAGNVLVKKLFAQNLLKQINAAIRNPDFQKDPRVISIARNILVTENIKLDKKIKLHHEAEEILHEYMRELIIETVIDLGKDAYASIGSGMVAKAMAGSLLKGITARTLTKATLSFGVEAVKGAGISFIANLLTKPLKGARLPPETIWTDILEEHPELILNPEWMNEAGSPDAPWFTHCYALERRGHLIEEAVETLLLKEEGKFKSEIRKTVQAMKPVNTHSVQAADRTYVYNPYSIKTKFDSDLPEWAITR